MKRIKIVYWKIVARWQKRAVERARKKYEKTVAAFADRRVNEWAVNIAKLDLSSAEHALDRTLSRIEWTPPVLEPGQNPAVEADRLLRSAQEKMDAMRALLADAKKDRERMNTLLDEAEAGARDLEKIADDTEAGTRRILFESLFRRTPKKND